MSLCATHHFWTPHSWWCVWMWRRCRWSSGEGTQGWWWASGGTCLRGSPVWLGQGKMSCKVSLVVVIPLLVSSNDFQDKPMETFVSRPPHLQTNNFIGIMRAPVGIVILRKRWKKKILTRGSHTGRFKLLSSGCFKSTGFGHSLLGV